MKKNIRKSIFNMIFGTYRSVAYFIYNALPRRMPKPSITETIDIVIPAISRRIWIYCHCVWRD